MKQTKIRIGLLGFGTVGSRTYALLNSRRSHFKRFGLSYEIASVAVRSKTRGRKGVLKGTTVVSDPTRIVTDPSIDIVIEVMGGLEPARTLLLQAMQNGKSVVTANKDLLATHGDELFTAADVAKVDLMFEASVGGGIPLVKPLKESLVGNRIDQIMGILNGTTNYILTKITEEKWDFKTALKEAQRLGYAERDPANDVEGKDAAYKLAILSSIAFNTRVQIKKVHYEGISDITPEDIMYAEKLGYQIKLLAIGSRVGHGIEVRVHPTMIPTSHPLSAVNGVFNAVFVKGDAVGDLMFYGRGAGGGPTASAVVGDVFNAMLNITTGSRGRLPCTCFEELKVLSINEVRSSYYLLIEVLDHPGVLAQIAEAFGKNGVSLDKVLQVRTSTATAEVMFLTHETEEIRLNTALSAIKRLKVVKKVKNKIRVENG